MITSVFLLGLAICWIAILVPPMVRGRAPRRRSSKAPDFHTALGKLDATRNRSASVTPLRSASASLVPARPGHSLTAPTSGMVAMVAKPESADDARRRRRNLIMALGGFASVTLLGALILGGPFVAVHLLTDVALLGYVMAVAQRQRLVQERRQKVTPLRPARRAAPSVSHDDLLRRSGT